MRCRICGAALRDGDDRCPDCGQSVAGPIRPAFESSASPAPAGRGNLASNREKPPATVGIAPGEVLAGRYEVEDEIGSGLLARLYRARDRATRAAVVLRVVHAGLITSRDEREATQRALRASVGIEGRHLCPVVDVGEHGERLFVVEPAVDAVPLGRVLRHRRARGETFAPREVLPVVAQTAAALASMPSGRAHGSIDPSLVLVHRDGLRLVGAHIAMALPAEALARATRNANVAALAYLAPEVRAGAKPTAASDRYAVAAIACECLTGRPSLSSVDDDDVDGDTAPSVRDESGARLPEGLRRCLIRCLDPVPEERATTLAELVAELASTAGLGVASLRDTTDGADASASTEPASVDGPTPRRDPSERTRKVALEPVVAEVRVVPTPPRPAAPAGARGSPTDTDATAPHAALTLDPSAPTQEEPLPSSPADVVTGGAAASTKSGGKNGGSAHVPAGRSRDEARARAVARRPAGGAAEGTAEIELDQIIDEHTAGRAAAAEPAHATATTGSTRPARDRRDSGSAIPSLGGARKSPSLPSLSVPLPAKAAAAAPAGMTSSATTASGARSIPVTTSGSIPIELVELDLPPAPEGQEGGHSDGEPADAPVPSLLSAARRHASRPQMRAVTSDPPRAQSGPVVPGHEPVVVPEGVIGIPRVRPPSGEHRLDAPSEVLFDDSLRPRPQTRHGDPTRTEVYDRATHDVMPNGEAAPRRRSRWIVWASVLLALVIVAVGLVIYLQRRDYAERRREIELQMQGRERPPSR
ncbi:MAG: protein kinase [Deltaproteobacteria bacterium]|nr:protein kinase [Deltaproteobacteria bacterium]